MMTIRQSAALFAESKRCVEQNRIRILESRRRAANARRHLNPWFAVSGGSENSDQLALLQARVRALLASGLLGPISGEAWGGQGTGKCCVVCGELIMPTQLQFEPDGAIESVAHVSCFLVWHEESKTFERERPLNLRPLTQSPDLPAEGARAGSLTRGPSG